MDEAMIVLDLTGSSCDIATDLWSNVLNYGSRSYATIHMFPHAECYSRRELIKPSGTAEGGKVNDSIAQCLGHFAQ